MTVHGVLDMRTWPANVNNVQNERYVALVNFLLSPQATSLGINQIASYYGVGGTGHGYWDETPHVGEGAFTVWEFSLASTPFYMMLSYNSTGNTQQGNSSPCSNDNLTTSPGVYAAFVMRVDGTNPWNGSINVNGLDTKGTPVWTAGGSTLLAWPRTNSVGGGHSTNAEDCVGFTTPANYWGRHHFMCDENHVLFAFNETSYSNDTGYAFMYFGKYNPRNGTTPTCPYVLLRSNTTYIAGGQHGENPPFPPSATFPSYAFTNAAYYNGGIVHPSDPTQGVLTVKTDYISEFGGNQFTPTPQTGKIIEMPFFVGMAESLGKAGYMGYIDWVKYAWGMNNQSMTSDKTRAFLGASALQTWKLSVPWDGSTNCGSSNSRAGVIF
jgi:hypothetical protein